ncbi:MAG: prenyltransferase [Candidatus Gracilibacteria bacterium]
MTLQLLAKLLKISRPRFWTYLAGTFLLGVIYGIPSLNLLQTSSLIFFFLWFTFPANLFVYGINDIFDYDTDKNNPKKHTKEALVIKEEHALLKSWISIAITVGIILTSLFYSPVLGSLFLIFLFLSAFYSATPIRAKAIPLIDTLFNSLYVVPGIIGYYLSTHMLPPAFIVAAGVLWCMGMHAYSAIPDIQVDKNASLNTIATFLGKNGTLIFCTLCYIGSAYIVSLFSSWIGLLLGIYPVLMVLNFFFSEKSLERFYWLFPWVNTAVGAICVFMRMYELVL